MNNFTGTKKIVAQHVYYIHQRLPGLVSAPTSVNFWKTFTDLPSITAKVWLMKVWIKLKWSNLLNPCINYKTCFIHPFQNCMNKKQSNNGRRVFHIHTVKVSLSCDAGNILSDIIIICFLEQPFRRWRREKEFCLLAPGTTDNLPVTILVQI